MKKQLMEYASTFLKVSVLVAFSCQANGVQTTAQTITITLPNYKVELPPLAQILQDREAKPRPDEFALAQELRPLLDNSDYQQALTLLTASQKLSPALLLVKAQLQAQDSQFSQALITYEQALTQMPHLVRAHQGKAIILLLQKDYANAQQALSSAIQGGLHDLDAYTQLAYVNLQINDAWSAIGAFQQALMLDPNSISLRFGLLSALVKTKQINSALNLIDSLLKIEPENRSLWLQRANLAISIDDTDMAVSSLETAIRLGDDEPSNYIISAQLHLQQGNYTRVKTLLNNTVQFSQAQITGLMPLLAQKQQWATLENLLTKHQPKLEQLTGIEKSRYHLYQAQLARVNKKLSVEKSALALAIKADPTNGQALMTLANIYLEEQNYTAAEQYYYLASIMESVKKNALLGLAQTFLKQQNYQAALDNLIALSQLDPHNQDIARNIASIKRILAAKKAGKST
jgi:tetratricopeptide (TPR) repeat protein